MSAGRFGFLLGNSVVTILIRWNVRYCLIQIVPDLQRFISAAADDPLPVRAETHARDTFGVSFKCECFLAGLGIPDPHRVVFAAADDPLPIGAETHVGDRS